MATNDMPTDDEISARLFMFSEAVRRLQRAIEKVKAEYPGYFFSVIEGFDSAVGDHNFSVYVSTAARMDDTDSEAEIFYTAGFGRMCHALECLIGDVQLEILRDNAGGNDDADQAVEGRSREDCRVEAGQGDG